MRRPRVLITSGDPGGIGPELVLRALADPGTGGLADFTAIGAPACFQRAAAALGLPLPRIHPADPPETGADEVALGRPSAAGGRAAVAAVREAARLMAAGDGDALVTAPVSKEALRLAGYPWPGQTEMLADLCAARDLRVLLMAGPLRVVHVSAHRSLRDAIDAVTGASVLRTIELADDIGRRLLGRPARIAVAGLNPHAGEHGILGEEDERFIRPAVAQARAQGIDADGPLSADTLFPRAAAGRVDLVVAMYHDQGHIPVKLLGRDEGVAVTLGLPFLRMSPDHGAAFDIAGRGMARPGSMTAAIRAAVAAGRGLPVTARPAGAAPDGYLLALDAGTGGCRAALFTADGRPGALARRDWSHPADAGIPGSQSFDTAGNWALICACIREVLAVVPRPAAVLAVGCSSMGGGLVLYDRAGRELWACANGDARAGREAAAMLASGTAAELYRRGGGWISLSAPPRLAWVRRHEPDRWAAAARLSMIADWIVFRLTGTLVTGASIGSTSGMFDLGRRAWSPEIMTLCGLKPALFPEVVEAGTVAGRVSGAAFRQTGLPAGTPVAAGGLDTALGLADPRGAVPGRLTVTGGSFWKQTVAADSAAVEPAGRLRTICHVQPGQWLVEGISFYAGSALRWLRDQGVRAAAGRPAGYTWLEQLAAAVPPGARGLTARLAPADAWTWAQWQPPFPSRPTAGTGEQARAIQEAAAYSTRLTAGLLSEMLGRGAWPTVILTGGAARSTLWPQILADVLGGPVSVPDHVESAALGAAVLAGRGAGVLPGAAADYPPGAGRESPGSGRVAYPSPAGQQAYDLLYERWATDRKDVSPR